MQYKGLTTKSAKNTEPLIYTPKDTLPYAGVFNSYPHAILTYQYTMLLCYFIM